MKKIAFFSVDSKKIKWMDDFLNNFDMEKFIPYFFLLVKPNEEVLLEKYLEDKGISIFKIKYTNKKDLLAAIIQSSYILRRNKIDIVSCHFVKPSLVGLISAFFAGIKHRIYIRRHSTFHHLYFKRAVLYDMVCNFFATNIIATSQNVKDVLMNYERVDESKVTIIYNSIDIDEFKNVDEDRIKKIREKYGIDNKYFPVIGVVSRFIEWKGIQYIIPAFKRLLVDYPDACLVLANAIGPYTDAINKMLSDIPQSSYRKIEFETDIAPLYKIFDIFVHVPVNKEIEAFGNVYIEALASGVPSVVTLSGIANEIIRDNENAIVVDYESEKAIYNGIIRLLKDDKLRQRLINNGFKPVKAFTVKKRVQLLNEFYNKLK